MNSNGKSKYLPYNVALFSLLCCSIQIGHGKTVQTGVISGIVMDATTGQPLPGVNIILQNTVLGTSTNLDGRFTLSGIRQGTYSVVASMIGYKKETRESVAVSSELPVMLEFHLEESFVEMSPVVITASRRSQSLAETPNNVSVISAADIRKRNSVDIREALKYAPGVSFMANQVNIRGTTGYSRGAGSRVLLLTDGVPTMPGDSGDIKWDVVPYMVVDKVEVVKGAASALYGSSAISGVLNIITKEPANKPEFSIRATGGFYDQPHFSEWDWTDRTLFTNQQDVYISNTVGDLGFILSGGRRHSRGYKENSQFLRFNLFGKARYKLATMSNLTFTGSYASDDHGENLLWAKYLGQPKQPFRVPDGDAGGTILSTKLYLNSTWQHLANQNLGLKVRTSYYRNRFDNNLADNHDFSKSQRFRGEVQADLQPSVRHAVTTGFEATHDQVDGNFFGSREAFIVGSYLQDEVRVSDRFSMTAGLRFDYSSVVSGRTESQLSPKFGVIYSIGNSTSIKGSIGTGFRAPSIAELFTETRASGFQVVPNPDLKAENSWSAEVGMSTSISDHVLLNAAIYQERYFDFINPNLGFQDSLIIVFENVQDARIRGLETNLTTSWLQNRLSAVVSYVFVDPKDLETDDLLTYRPQHILTTSLTVRPGIFELGVDFRFASRLRQEQVEVFPGDARVSTKIWDLRAGASVDRLAVTLNIENLLQYHYTQIERTLEPVRQFSLTLQSDF